MKTKPPKTPVLKTGDRIVLTQEVGREDENFRDLPLLVWIDDTQTEPAISTLPTASEPLPLPVERKVYKVVDQRVTQIGDSFILHAVTRGAQPRKLFLKLPNLKEIFSERATDIAEHFREEFQTLAELQKMGKDLGGPVLGQVSQVYARATLYVSNPDDGAKRPDGPLPQVVPVPALIERCVEGKPLHEVLRSPYKNFFRTEGSARHQQFWFFLAFALANTLRRVHNHGVVHASIKPEHVMLGPKWQQWLQGKRDPIGQPEFFEDLLREVHLVGFGTSALLFDSKYSIEAKRRLKGNPFAAPELQTSGRVDGLYSYPVDIFSLGATLHYLATFQKAESKGGVIFPVGFDRELPRDVDGLKLHVASSIARSSPALARNEGIARVIDKCLRFSAADRFVCAEEMMRFIVNAAPADIRRMLLRSLDPEAKIEKALRTMSVELAAEAKLGESLLSHFVEMRVREDLAVILRAATRGHCEYWGGRDEILDPLCDYVGSLDQKDEYCTVTLPAYWTDNNLGANGRFLILNKDLARNLVRTRRIFLLASSFDQLPLEEQHVLLSQAEAARSLRRDQRDQYFQVRVLELKEKHQLNLNQCQRNLVAFTTSKIPARESIGVNFMSHGEEYRDFETQHLKLTITKVRFRRMDPAQVRHDVSLFESRWRDAVSVETYIGGGQRLTSLLAPSRAGVA